MANTEIKDLLIRIRADTDQAMKNLEGVHSSTNNLGKVAAVAGKAFMVAGAAITGALAMMVKDAAASELGTAKLNATLASTKGVAGMTAESLAKIRTELAGVTMFGAGAQKEAQNLLLTFTGIGKDVFPQAQEAVLNMSTVLGQDLKSSSIQLGKALQDPILGVTALRKVGVNFNEAAKDTIAKMVETGNVAGAQAFILAELTTEFGGAARAAGQTFTGQLTILQNGLEGIGVSIGTQLLPVLMELVKSINERMPEIKAALVPLFAGIGKVIADMLPIILQLIDAVLPPLLDIFKELIPIVLDLIKAFLPIIKEILPPLTDLILYLVKEVLPLFTPIIGELVRAVIPPLVEILKMLVKDVLPPLMPLIKVFAELLVSLTPVISTLLKALMPLIELGIKILAFQLNLVIPIITFLIEKCIIPLVGVLDKVLKAFIPLNTFIKDTFIGMMQKLKNIWYDVRFEAMTLRDKIVEIGTTIKTKLSALYEDMKNIGKNIINGILDGLKAGWNLLLDKIKSLGNLIPDWLKKILGIESPSKVMKEIFKWIIPGIVDGIMVNINNLDNISAQIGAKLKTGLSNIAVSIGSFDGFKALNDMFKDVTVKEFNRFLGEIKEMIDKITEMGLAFQSINPVTIVGGIKSFITSMSIVASELKKLFNTGSMVANDPNSLTGLFDQLKTSFNTLNEMFKGLSIANVLTFMEQIKSFITLLSEIGASEIKKGAEGFKGILETMIEIFSSDAWVKASEIVKKAIQDFADVTKTEFATTAQSVKENWVKMVQDIQTSITLNLVPLQTAMITASNDVKNAFISDKNSISDGWTGAIDTMSLSASTFKGQISEMLDFLKAVATGEGIDSTGIKNTFLMLTQVVADLTNQLYESIFKPVLDTFGMELMKIPDTIRQTLLKMMSDMRAELITIVQSLADAFTSRWTTALTNFITQWKTSLQTVKADAIAWAEWFNGWVDNLTDKAIMTISILGSWIELFRNYIEETIKDVKLLFDAFATWMCWMWDWLVNAGYVSGGVGKPHYGEDGDGYGKLPPEIGPPPDLGPFGAKSNPWEYMNQNNTVNPVVVPMSENSRPIQIQNLTVNANNAEEFNESMQRAARQGLRYAY